MLSGNYPDLLCQIVHFCPLLAAPKKKAKLYSNFGFSQENCQLRWRLIADDLKKTPHQPRPASIYGK